MITIFLLLLTINIIAGNTDNYNFAHINVKNGLLHDHVLCITQDSKGFIWIGTYGGLQRYDGKNLKSYSHLTGDEHSIISNAVHVIYEDPRHNWLWIGTEGGLDRFDLEQETFTHFTHDPSNPNSLSHNNVRSVWYDDDSLLWIGTYGGGIDKYNVKTGRWKNYMHNPDDPGSLCSNLVNVIYVDNVNRMWVGTEAGGLSLFDWNNGTFTNYIPSPTNKNSITDDIVNSIVLDRKGILWLGTWNSGVCSFNPEKKIFKGYKVNPEDPDAVRSSIVRSVMEDAYGTLWFASLGGGLISYNRERDNFITHFSSGKNAHSLSNNFLWALFEDRSGVIWVGTFGSGVDIFDPKRKSTRNYYFSEDSPNGLSSNMVSSILQTRDGSVWIGTIGGGLNKMEETSDKFVHYLQNPDPRKAIIRTIFEDSRGLIWIGTDQGLYVLNRATGIIKLYHNSKKNPHSITDSGIYCIGEDKNGAIWIGIWNNGLDKLDPGEIEKIDPAEAVFTHFRHDPDDTGSLSSNSVWTIYTDRYGYLWVGNENCLEQYNYNTGKFRHISNFNYSSIVEDSKGNLWLGSYSGEITKFDRKLGTTEVFRTNKITENKVIIGIAMDSEGFIWIATQDGVFKYNPATNELIALDLSIEMQENEYGLNTMKSLSNGEIILGGDHGISILDPKLISYSNKVPEVELTGLNISDVPVPILSPGEKLAILNRSIIYTDSIKLSYKNSLLRFDFTAFDFLSRDKLQYAYLMKDYDKDWNYTTDDKPYAIYSNLPPGKYVLRIKASFHNNNWSRERLLYIEIKPPYYQTWWYRISLALLILILVGGFYLRRIRSLKLKESRRYLMEKQVKELEINKLNKEKLDTELEFRKKELASYALYNIRKNEKLMKLRDELQLIMKIALPKSKNKIREVVKEIEGNIDDTGNWDYFEQNFNLLHNDFLKRFAVAFPDLTYKDLKICAFIRMNLDNKEIAKILHITPDSLGVSRTRIRKKINLDKDTYLNDFILRF